MKFRIHFELPSGEEDSVDISGESLEALTLKAETEVSKRGGKNAWSEAIG